MAQLQATGITGSLTILGSITASIQSQEYELITKTIVDGTPIAIDFTLNSSTYKKYKLILTDFGQHLAAGSTNLVYMRLSSDGGIAFQTIDYVLQTIGSGSLGTPGGNASSTFVNLTNSSLNASSRLSSEVVITMQPNILINSSTVGTNATPRLTQWISFNRPTSATLPNFLRIGCTNSNAMTGSIYFLGLRN